MLYGSPLPPVGSGWDVVISGRAIKSAPWQTAATIGSTSKRRAAGCYDKECGWMCLERDLQCILVQGCSVSACVSTLGRLLRDNEWRVAFYGSGIGSASARTSLFSQSAKTRALVSSTADSDRQATALRLSLPGPVANCICPYVLRFI